MENFGAVLKDWRKRRRMSQLDLSLEAAISARHLSFLESGRSQPSRTMVITLTGALAMPPDAVNGAMIAAGYAPIYDETPLQDGELADVHHVITSLLQRHDPFPAMCLDRHWNLMQINQGAAYLFRAFGMDPPPIGQPQTGEGTVNMVDVLIALGHLGDAIPNWEMVAFRGLTRLKSEWRALGGDSTLQSLIDRLAAHPRLAGFDGASVDLARVTLPTRFNIPREGMNDAPTFDEVSFLTTITQLGSVQHAVLSDVKIEMFFPADAHTQDLFAQRVDNA